MATKIKVDRLLLINALKAEQKKIEAEHKLATESYAKEIRQYPAVLAAELEKLAAKIRKGYALTFDSYHRRPHVSDYLPAAPAKPPAKPATCELKRQIATLTLSKESVIVVDENSAYVKFACAV